MLAFFVFLTQIVLENMACLHAYLFNCVRLFGTLWTIARQDPLSMEFSRQEYWSGLPFPSPRDLPHPRMEPGCPELQVDSLPAEPTGKPLGNIRCYLKKKKKVHSQLSLRKQHEMKQHGSLYCSAICGCESHSFKQYEQRHECFPIYLTPEPFGKPYMTVISTIGKCGFALRINESKDV